MIRSSSQTNQVSHRKPSPTTAFFFLAYSKAQTKWATLSPSVISDCSINLIGVFLSSALSCGKSSFLTKKCDAKYSLAGSLKVLLELW